MFTCTSTQGARLSCVSFETANHCLSWYVNIPVAPLPTSTSSPAAFPQAQEVRIAKLFRLAMKAAQSAMLASSTRSVTVTALGWLYRGRFTCHKKRRPSL